MEKFKKKVIIFDMDGVIFDTIPFARKVYMENHPGVTEEMYNEIHTGNFHEEAAKYSYLLPKETEEEKATRHKNYSTQKSKCKLFDGIKELLQELHSQGFILVLNTNAYEQNTLPILENSSIDTLFDFITSANLSKNKIEKFIQIATRYNANTNEMLFITDALGDVREADMADIPTLAVTWGVHNQDYFNREQHSNLVGIVKTISELKKNILNFYE